MGEPIDDSFPAAEVVAPIAGLPPLKWVVRVHPCCPECDAPMWVLRRDDGAEVWCDGCGHSFRADGVPPEQVGTAVSQAWARQQAGPAGPADAPAPGPQEGG